MKNITLSDEEVSGINMFIADLYTIPVVEAVYLLPPTDSDGEKERCEVVALLNNSLYYNGLITGAETYRCTDKERTNLAETISEYNGLFKNGRLCFEKDSSSNYCVSMMHRREFVAMQELLNGTILFDRFGEVSKKREAILNYLKPYSNKCSVSNISEVIADEEHIKELIKNKEEENK